MKFATEKASRQPRAESYLTKPPRPSREIYFFLPIALISFLFPSLGRAQPVLDSQSLNESGGSLSTGNIQLLDAAGQAAIGQAQAGADDLGLGYLYTLISQPQIALLSPAGPGICSVVKGTVTVAGFVQSPQLADWRLDFAPGPNAASGFTMISSGSLNVSTGTLGVWSSASLNGFQTLRLVARDQTGGAAVAFSSVFIGDPALLLTVTGFNKPEGVAAGLDGAIYVADRDNDRIVVLTSTGGTAAVLGGRHAGAGLNKPSAVAVDGLGNIYVADTNNDRAVKLSPSGRVLLELSKQGKPASIALDHAGNIYVSQARNHRVQEFDPSGLPLASFILPPVPAGRSGQDEPTRKEGRSPEDEQDKDDDKPELGTPAGLALDEAGALYVADRRGGRVVVFASSGTLARIVGSHGRGPGQFNQPRGAAVNPSGDCLLVSDTNGGRIEKFDRFGSLGLVIGGNGLLNKPAGLALDLSGKLYAADRNNDRLLVYGVPSSLHAAGLASRAAAAESQEKPLDLPAAPAEFVFRDLYAFPNPARRNELPTIRLQTGLADSVDIAIYDVSGQRVGGATIANSRILDDGNGKGYQYTYDYPWDTGHVGPGVYIFMVTAHKAGQKDIRKASKIAVIK